MWAQLIAWGVGEASKGINVGAPDVSQLQAKTSPTEILAGVGVAAAIGATIWWAMK